MYDRRIGKEVNGQKTRYVYDGDAIAMPFTEAKRGPESGVFVGLGSDAGR
jgi:hypothetical protein